MSNSPRRKFKLKCELTIPGLYADDLISKTASKKRRISSQLKMQPSQLENYEFKVLNIFEKHQKQSLKLLNKTKPEKERLTKKELIEKIVNQMQNHLQKKEKELFETEQDKTIHFEKRKSQFYQDQQHLAMLEQMKERFAQQQEIQKKKHELQLKKEQRGSQSNSSPIHVKLYRRQSNFETYQYEQEQIENGLQEYYKLQRIKLNVEKELSRMGLTEQSSSDYKLKSRKLSLNGNNNQSLITQQKSKSNPKTVKTININNYTLQTGMQTIEKSQSKSKSNPKTINVNTNNILKRIKDKLQFSNTHYATLNTNNSMSTLITNCDQEIAQLKQIDTDIVKKKKNQIRKFRVIQSDLDAIAFMRFQKAKDKPE